MTDASAAKMGKGFASSFPAGSVPRSANTLADLHAWRFDHFMKTHADEVKKFDLSPAARGGTSNTTIRHGDLNRGGDTFNIHTSDAKSGLDHAVRVSARRGAEDRIRNGQG